MGYQTWHYWVNAWASLIIYQTKLKRKVKWDYKMYFSVSCWNKPAIRIIMITNQNYIWDVTSSRFHGMMAFNKYVNSTWLFISVFLNPYYLLAIKNVIKSYISMSVNMRDLARFLHLYLTLLTFWLYLSQDIKLSSLFCFCEILLDTANSQGLIFQM